MTISRQTNTEGERAVFLRSCDFELSAFEDHEIGWWLRFWFGSRTWSHKISREEFDVLFHLAAPAAATEETHEAKAARD